MMSSMTSSGFISRSHKAIAPFRLERPNDVAEAARLLGQGAVAHAGGIDVVERLQQGVVADRIVALDHLDELRRIDVEGDRLVLGSGVTHAAVENHPRIAATRPDVAAAWRTVGNVRIRRTGTIGGNLMALDRTYDAAPILAAADALLHVVGPDGEPSTIAVGERDATRLLVAISIPLDGRIAFDRTLKPVVSVAAGPTSIAIGCAFGNLVVVDRPDGEPAEAAQAMVGSLDGWCDDAEASASYRRRMTEVMVRRTLEALS